MSKETIISLLWETLCMDMDVTICMSATMFLAKWPCHYSIYMYNHKTYPFCLLSFSLLVIFFVLLHLFSVLTLYQHMSNKRCMLHLQYEQLSVYRPTANYILIPFTASVSKSWRDKISLTSLSNTA